MYWQLIKILYSRLVYNGSLFSYLNVIQITLYWS